ncbi:trypsin-like serine peptidase [Cupriavidus sp. D39]|uniref:trypsin-like serine peptidase n=1 Tax=Cupriavidus sp. D39 TaxID=2997877 RepID=UPI0022713A16|nr:hypothetical protein [Cupriavidus sp. D39]MCY0854043.1 hypothetical protein [Cupriavidus sp. D39]
MTKMLKEMGNPNTIHFDTKVSNFVEKPKITKNDVYKLNVNSGGPGGGGGCPTCASTSEGGVKNYQTSVKLAGGSGPAPATPVASFGDFCDSDDLLCNKSAKSFSGMILSNKSESPCDKLIASLDSNGILGTLDQGALLAQTEAAGNSVSDAQTIIRKYADACLSSDIPAYVKDFVGVLVTRDGDVIGMATVVDSATIVTARHVVYGNANSNSPTPIRMASDVRFIPANRPDKVVEIDKDALNGFDDRINPTQLSQTKDIAFLKLAEAIGNSPRPYPRKRTLDGSNFGLVVAGVNVEEMKVSGIRPLKNGTVDPRWVKYLKTDRRATLCQALITRSPRPGETCVLHGCSSFPGVSGAGVFDEAAAKSSIRESLVGIHVGTPKPSCNRGVDGSSTVNVAVAPKELK